MHKSKPDLLGFDLLYQLTHMSAVAAAGVTRAKMISLAAELPTSTAHHFEEVDRIATSMSYQYAEACRIVGEKAEEEEIRGFLLRLSSALDTGESESEFLAAEAEIQAEVYGNVYERKLETLKKWTDAFTALIVSASLIIVVATVSTMIFDLGTTFVGGLVVAMVGISGLGVWILYRAAPQEIRTLRGPGGELSQAKSKKTFMMVFPAALVFSSLAMLVSLDFGIVLLIVGVMFIPIGLVAKKLDKRITKVDEDVATFFRTMGTTVSAIGTTPVVAMGRMDMRSMPTLVTGVHDLRTRLVARVHPLLSWTRFVDETGSELVGRCTRVFLDGTGMGGDAEHVGKQASLMGSKINQLRAKRRLVSDSFTYLTLAMHVVIAFLLVFIVEVVNGFNTLIATAGVDVPGGPGAALGSVLAFNLSNLELLRNAMIPIVVVLSVVNALAPKVASGAYSHTFFYYLGFTLLLSGVAVAGAPVMAELIFGVGEVASEL